MIIQIVRYASRLSRDDVQSRFEARSDRYRQVPGLLQKYYVHFTETDEYGGVYLWDSRESLDAWTAGNLSGTLAETYQIEGEPLRELLDVMLVLRPVAGMPMEDGDLRAAAGKGKA